MNTGREDRLRYQSIEKWGPGFGLQLYDSLAPVKWWKENGGYMGSNACNTLK